MAPRRPIAAVRSPNVQITIRVIVVASAEKVERTDLEEGVFQILGGIIGGAIIIDSSQIIIRPTLIISR